MEEIKEPIIIKSIVNGLISTSIIWLFWTPFLIFMAAPLMNAMIKNFLCSHSTYISYEIYKIFGIQAYEVYENNLPNPPTIAKRIVNNNTNNFLNENLNLFIVFGILSLLVIYFSLSIAGNLISKYNLNLGKVILFNIIMSIIIIAIEIAFFIGVTTEYSPFDLKNILEGLIQKIKNVLVPLSSSNTLTKKKM
jgi:hypothetical protein